MYPTLLIKMLFRCIILKTIKLLNNISAFYFLNNRHLHLAVCAEATRVSMDLLEVPTSWVVISISIYQFTWHTLLQQVSSVISVWDNVYWLQANLSDGKNNRYSRLIWTQHNTFSLGYSLIVVEIWEIWEWRKIKKKKKKKKTYMHKILVYLNTRR